MDQIIKHFYADLVKTLPMDDPCFRSMLYSANLLPGNLKDEVKSMPTRAEKAEHFLDHGINNDTAKFLKLFEVLKQSDDNSVIKLTAQLRNEIDPHAVSNVTEVSQPVEKTQEPVLNFDMNEFENITEAFLFLTSNVSKLLQTGDFYTIRRACIEQTNTPNGAQLSPDMMHKITSTNNLNGLLDTLALSPYWSWIDLRLLQAIVVASGSVKAKNLLTSYKNAVFSKKLIDVISEVPNKEVKDEYYTKTISKFDKEFEEITIFDLLKRKSQLETVIMDLKKGTCALAHISAGCIEIHWFVPTNYIDDACKAASLNRYKYDTLHLQYLQIGTMNKIYNPSILHSLHPDVAEPPLPVNAATCKDVIDHFSHYLTNEMDSDSIVEHMLSQQLLKEQEIHTIMSAASSFQKNCLILENIRLMNTQSLVCFCDILQMLDYQKHIASVLLNALHSFDFLSSGAVTQSTDNIISYQQPERASIISIDRSRKRPASSEQPTGQKYFRPSSVDAEFLDMKLQLEQMLQDSNAQTVYEQCESLMASQEHDVALFSTDYLSSLKECNEVPEILQRLSPYFNWSDHSVLHALVQACYNSEAAMLLQQFDSQVDLSLPITEYPIPQPIPSMAPYDTSTQTVLAVKLNTELKKLSLQQVTKLRCLIQKNFKITEHSLQLMAAKSSSAILYWLIPKCISHLIDSKFLQDSSLHGSRVQEVCIYPGTLFVSADILKLGSLSFLNEVDHTLHRNETEVLSMHLNHLEQLPNTMSKLIQRDTTEGLEEHIEVQTERDDQLDQNEVIASEVSVPTSSYDMKAVLKHVKSQNEELRTQLKESRTYEKALQQQITKAEEKYLEVNQMYEKLKMFSSAKEVEDQLSSMLRKVVDVKSAFGSIGVIKIKYIQEQTYDKSAALSGEEEIIVNHLHTVNRELETLEEWSKLLQVELADNKHKINSLQEENEIFGKKCSDYKSELMVKDKELFTLQEDNRLLAKQFRQKKDAQKRREKLLQEQIIKQEQVGSGQFGSVSKISYSTKLYAGKSLYPKLVPGYPNSSADQTKQFIKEFENKLTVCSYFLHSNIELFETSIQLVNENLPTLLSELLPENLDKFTTRMKGNLPIHQQLDLCNDMANGLQYLHGVGLVHTNLHGRNVLVSHDGHAKIGDYICPQVISSSEEVPTNNIPYLPPEAIKDKSLYNEQSDVYSLGVLFLQVATQNIPQPSDNTELSKISKRKEELAEIKHHPLLSVIHKCVTNIRRGRPSVTQVSEQIATAKESPQSVLSYSLYSKMGSQSLQLQQINTKDLPWFHGNVSRDEAVRRLNAAKNGLFVIREISSNPGDYALSISFEDGVFHYILKTNENNQVYFEYGSKLFDNLSQLVEHYKSNKYELPVKLRIPVDKNEITRVMHETDEAKQAKEDDLIAQQRSAMGSQSSQLQQINTKDLPWFHGNVSRDEVMRRLNAAKNGVFIIRESSSHPGNYALSVSFEDGVFHYILKINENNQVYFENGSKLFDNLSQLVEHYKSNKYELPVKLRIPVDKNEIIRVMHETDEAKQAKEDDLIAQQRSAHQRRIGPIIITGRPNSQYAGVINPREAT